MSNTATAMFSLRRGDVFIGRHAHTDGKVLRIEGAEGPWFLVRHRGSAKVTPVKILPTTLFSSWEVVGEERGAELFPWTGDRSVVGVSSADMPEPKARTSRKRDEGKPAAKRARLEPSTGSVSVMPGAAMPPPAHTAPSSVVMAQPANDAPASPGLAKANIDEAVERAVSSQIAIILKDQRDRDERNQAMMLQILERLSLQHVAPAATHPAAPPKTKEQEREEATNKQVNEEMPWAKPQLERFISENMEIVSFSSQAEIERALKPGEVFEQFSLWCEVNGLRVPFPKTVYQALLNDSRTKARWKLSGKVEKTPLAIRRQTRFGFDEAGPVGKDVQAVMTHARKTVWPSLPETYRETIAKVLMDKVSKADILAALDHIAAMPRHSEGAYKPESVLRANHIRALVRLARAEGPAK